MFSAEKKRFTGGFLFIQKQAILMQKAARIHSKVQATTRGFVLRKDQLFRL